MSDVSAFPSRIVIFSGISGTNKTQLIKDIIKYADREKETELLKFEDILLKGDDSTDIAQFLQKESLRGKMDAIEKASATMGKLVRGAVGKTVVIDAHLSYYLNSNYILNLGFQNSLAMAGIPGIASNDDRVPITVPIKVINLIDDAYIIRQKLKDRADDYPGTEMRLREILSWRSLESSASEVLAQNLSNENRTVKSYLMAVRNSKDSLRNLLFSDDPKCVYLSFPISNTRDDRDSVTQINDFRKKLHTKIEGLDSIVLDPVTIDEKILTNGYVYNKPGEKKIRAGQRWPIELPSFVGDGTDPVYSIPNDEILEVYSDIDYQIKSRDYKLVDNSSLVVAYEPYMGGSLSTGVDAEMRYAHFRGKRVYVRSEKNPASKSKNPFAKESIVLESDEAIMKQVEKSLRSRKKSGST